MNTVGPFAAAVGLLALLMLGCWALSSLAAWLIAARLHRTNARAGTRAGDDMMAVAQAAGVVPDPVISAPAPPSPQPDKPAWARFPTGEYPPVPVRLGRSRLHRACIDARSDARQADICDDCLPRLGIPRKQVTP
jgi:hypothetical protein